MKKKITQKRLKIYLPLFLALAVILIVPLFFISCGKAKNFLTTYCMDLRYDDEACLLSGNEEVKYYNNSENMFNILYFHLYPNAFREGAKNPVISQTHDAEGYPNGKSYGNIEINGVKCQDEELNFTIEGEDENILAVNLNNELFPDESVQLLIDFTVHLPNINHRFGYGESTINFGNFYPIACVYEENVGFSKSLYHSNGDPFYSEGANYDVTIEFNSKYQIASSGDLILSENSENLTKNQYKASNVRDFCFVLSQKFKQVQDVVDDIVVNYYGYEGDENLNECLKTSVDALKTFNDMIGKYPYSQISVVKSNFVYGGMEFPNLVLISDKIEEQIDLNYVIIHEIAHQWWYGVVGNDQYNHAWIDEGLAEYSTLLFYEKNGSYNENYEQLISGATKSYKLFEDVYKKINGKVDGRMDRPICDFVTEPEYTQCTYTKSVLMFDSIRELIGKNKFEKTMQKMYKDYKFKIINRAQVAAIFEKFGAGAEKVIDSYLEGKVIIM